MSRARGLTGVTEFVVPLDLLGSTLKVLAEAGTKGHEAFMAWGGTLDEDHHQFRFGSAIRPTQTPVTTPNGLLVIVDGDALFELNRAMYARGEILGAQVHAHPTEAYHSDTDDCLPIATMVGALSLVVHDFAQHGLHQANRWAWYRLQNARRWVQLDDSTTISVVR
jgi:hypothetical protein